ncbi:MAG TPA: amidohydrolase family protein [Candidatus Aminicenantes bacterium]|nr:amidohydrolase family protein [Candidatus Aminicenantes bacterium]HRY66041.1 amidohydrolase family protein [Candidatus Aminicenantes bacterium]HRZ72910.1 amidohydrolase family protein [Candidatus Aminicenantes bacterium]
MKEHRPIRLALLLALALGLAAGAPHRLAAAGPDFDILIKNGLVLDGSLKPAFRADVAVKDGRIVRVAPSLRGPAARTIDARGLYVAPGFIDLHTHVDRALPFPEHRAPLGYLTQGVTTLVGGQCGTSAWPIFEKASDQIRRFTEEGVGLNIAMLVGHGSVRQLVMGMEDRAPTPDELERMKALVKEAMEQGAVGLSTGLIYRPGLYAKTDEILELVKVIAPYGGIYHSHVRNERGRLLEAIKECLAIAEGAGVRANISHFKVMRRANWGLVGEAMRLVEAARARGLRITADQYPYRFSNTEPYSPLVPAEAWRGGEPGLAASDLSRAFARLRDADLLELYAKCTPWTPLSPPHLDFLNGLPRDRFVDLVASAVLEGRTRGAANERERALFVRRLGRPEEARAIRAAVQAYYDDVGAENMIIAVAADESIQGKSLADVAALRKKTVVDTAIELELAGTLAVPFNMCEPDIEAVMAKDYVATGSDGILPVYGIERPHPRSYSTFLYKIQRYVLERKVLTLSQAIRSQTSLPADIMNWPDRGRIAEGAAADIVVLDLKGIAVPSSISAPHRLSRGVRHLLVNGRIVLDGGNFTGTLAGKVLGR